jgi:inosose dehydratase
MARLRQVAFRLGNAPTSWGVEKDVLENRPSWSTFLDDVSGCGYEGVELGPLGFLPTDPAVLAAELRARSLSLTAGYVMGPMHTTSGREELLAEGKQVLDLLGEVGASHLVIIGGIVPERAATAGRTEAAPRLDESAFSVELETVHRLGEMAARRGVRAGLHPHAGSYLEFDDEVDRLLEASDPALVGLVLDTGHFAYAGMDPVAKIREHRDRLSYVHLKDIDPEVLANCRQHAVGFWDAYRAGVFCVLGSGLNDFGAVGDALSEVGYDGWLTVEQDADPAGSSDPRRDAIANLELLRSVGLASAL